MPVFKKHTPDPALNLVQLPGFSMKDIHKTCFVYGSWIVLGYSHTDKHRDGFSISKMFGYSLQFSILKNALLVCSKQPRIAHTTASQTHRHQALKKAAHTYAALQTHLSIAILSYEERNSLN